MLIILISYNKYKGRKFITYFSEFILQILASYIADCRWLRLSYCIQLIRDKVIAKNWIRVMTHHTSFMSYATELLHTEYIFKIWTVQITDFQWFNISFPCTITCLHYLKHWVCERNTRVMNPYALVDKMTNILVRLLILVKFTCKQTMSVLNYLSSWIYGWIVKFQIKVWFMLWSRAWF